MSWKFTDRVQKQFDRLGCRAIREDRLLLISSIRKRSGAYTAD